MGYDSWDRKAAVEGDFDRNTMSSAKNPMLINIAPNAIDPRVIPEAKGSDSQGSILRPLNRWAKKTDEPRTNSIVPTPLKKWPGRA
jgi:hypothetical protein